METWQKKLAAVADPLTDPDVFSPQRGIPMSAQAIGLGFVVPNMNSPNGAALWIMIEPGCVFGNDCRLAVTMAPALKCTLWPPRWGFICVCRRFPGRWPGLT
jgi:hypothetical protein